MHNQPSSYFKDDHENQPFSLSFMGGDENERMGMNS
jgi:hypothetical protein